MTPAAAVAALRSSRGFAHKRDIERAGDALAGGAASGVRAGDDCAAIPDADGWALFAIEGLVRDFVDADPWFAGWCAVMVNASDVAAMGGRTIAVVDAIWARDAARGAAILAGMADASRAYGIPIVGGHTNFRDDRETLAVAVYGRARALLASDAARPGDALLAAVDLRGAFREPFPYWNATEGAPHARLRGDLELLPELAEAGLCRAAKDVSMGGVLGSALMLLESAGLGAEIDLAALPRPPGVALERWLAAFPSFGFVLACDPGDAAAASARFAARGIACARVGACDASSRVVLASGGERAELWDLAREPFVGVGARVRASAP